MCALAGLIGGLCLPVSAMTTATTTSTITTVGAGIAPTPHSLDGMQLAQTDLTLQGGPDDLSYGPVAEAVELPAVTPIKPPTRIALLLPTLSDSLKQVATAVQAGFTAAYQYEPANITVNLIETGDAAQDVLTAYRQAAADNDIVVGPLTRSGATAIVQNHAVIKPTIALTQLDAAESGPISSNMLMMGLSVEDEARQDATWMSVGQPHGLRAMAISTSVSWQRRAAGAFAAKWQALGMRSDMVELETGSGFISANGMLELRKRIQAEQPALLFLALDAAQAIQLRMAIGNDVPMVGTSQLNPVALDDWPNATRLNDLEGVMLVDVPWQLQPDHAAVMAYPHLPPNPDQRRSPDIERLYALGIDAYRVAHNLALQEDDFQLDGVTGRLAIRFGNGRTSFDRIMPTAVYRDGMVQPLTTPVTP